MDIFEILYKEFWEEAKGAALMFTNDHAGYARWYKNHLYGLCLKYSASQQAVQADTAICEHCKRPLKLMCNCFLARVESGEHRLT